ncbi:MAG: hypothetical protein IKW46_07160 [Bacteroidaceae bacterium]|nr:hypothetical protein [Bacteroidaceae bacterium]
MKRLLDLLICRVGVFLLLVLVSCEKETMTAGGTTGTGQEGDTVRKTLLVYMMAENTLNDFAKSDVAEILKAVPAIPDDCRLFVYVDDCEFPLLSCYSRLSSGDVSCSDIDVFTEDVCSSDTVALGTVFDIILDDYPTESLDIVLWSHGDGWLPDNSRTAPMRTIGIDNGKNIYNDRTTKAIEIDELAALLERLPVKVNRLMFDACFMQGVEVAYALRNAVEWVIASPAEIPGDGAPYETVVNEFFASDGVKGILDAYNAAYEGEAMGVVLSAAYMPAMQHLADVSYSNICNYFSSSENAEYAEAFSYLPGGAWGMNGVLPCFYDANAVMKACLPEAEYAVWKEALDAAVPYAVTTGSWFSIYSYNTHPVDKSVYSGISMYVPQASSRYATLNVDFAATRWYSAAGWSTAGW